MVLSPAWEGGEANPCHSSLICLLSTSLSTPHLGAGTQKRGACTWGSRSPHCAWLALRRDPGPQPTWQSPPPDISEALFTPGPVLLQVLPSGIFNVDIRRVSKPQQQGGGGVFSEEQGETTLGREGSIHVRIVEVSKPGRRGGSRSERKCI